MREGRLSVSLIESNSLLPEYLESNLKLTNLLLDDLLRTKLIKPEFF